MPLCRGSHGHGDGLCSSAGTHTASRPAPAWDLLVHVSIMCALCAHVRDEEEEQTFCLAKSGLRRPRPLSSSHCPTCHAPPNHETPSGMRQRSNMLNAARESKVQDTGIFAAAAVDRAPGACRTAHAFASAEQPRSSDSTDQQAAGWGFRTSSTLLDWTTSGLSPPVEKGRCHDWCWRGVLGAARELCCRVQAPRQCPQSTHTHLCMRLLARRAPRAR